MKPIATLGVMQGDLWSIPMSLRPFVHQLSIVTAYIAFAFVGAIVLGVF
jgi:hypothetical protein